MSAELRGYLKRQIIDHGPVDIGTFMSTVLGHERYGYYMRKDPFGRGGDFTTAPEISQMFGEMLGAWCADVWSRLGRPSSFSLVECGPGRGTLMADAMRATARVPGFHGAARLGLVEISPVLKESQGRALESYKPRWFEDVADVPAEGPLLLLANEFLDALPVRQLVRTAEGWGERTVGLRDGAFVFGLVPAPGELLRLLPPEAAGSSKGTIFELSPARINFVRRLAQRLRRAGGAALFIDYGYDRRAPGDTVQAVYRHQYCGVLEHIGDADLTAHVDFAALGGVARQEGLSVAGPAGQGEFLKALGIELRAQALAKVATERQRGDIAHALERLTGEGGMGRLFRVMAVSAGDNLQLPGFRDEHSLPSG